MKKLNWRQHVTLPWRAKASHVTQAGLHHRQTLRKSRFRIYSMPDTTILRFAARSENVRVSKLLIGSFNLFTIADDRPFFSNISQPDKS